MPTFAERLAAVIGPGVALHGWAMRHGLPPPKVWDWIKNDRKPRRPQLVELEAATGIPVEWWLNGELPPPLSDQGAPGSSLGGFRDESPSSEPSVPNPEQKKGSAVCGRINVKALAAIIEGALKTAPHASPRAIAEHSAKIYAQAIQDGLITPDGVGPGKVDKAA